MLLTTSDSCARENCRRCGDISTVGVGYAILEASAPGSRRDRPNGAACCAYEVSVGTLKGGDCTFAACARACLHLTAWYANFQNRLVEAVQTICRSSCDSVVVSSSSAAKMSMKPGRPAKAAMLGVPIT